MKIRRAISTFSIAAAVSLAIAPLSPAISGCAYVVDSDGANVRDSSKNCVKTTSWKEEAWTEACGKPAQVAEAPPAPEPVAPPPPAPEPEVMSISDTGQANFAFDSAKLTSAGRSNVDGVVDKLHGYSTVKSISIVGHTDSIGSNAYNQKLSERRANSVRDHMVSRGVNPELLSTSGMGEEAPIADNGTKEGRAQNRRVEITVDGTKKQ